MRSKLWVSLFVVAVLAMIGYVVVDGTSLVYNIAYAAAKDAATKASNEAARDQLAEMSKQDHMSALFAQVAKVLKPAVVEVKVTKKVRMMTPDMGGDMDEFFRRFFGDEAPGIRPRMPQPQPRQPREFLRRGLGSGVIVDAKNGYVLTNYHVVAGADETQVVLPGGKSLKTTWIRTDKQTDLAVLKVEAQGLIDAPLGDSDAMQVGDWVLAIGSPEGLEQTVTAGIISAMKRSTGEPNTYQSFIQTDASINHGNSGGPLVNMKGEVIGINTAIVSQTGVNEGIGLSIPSKMVKSIMAQLIEKGKVTRGYLGVQIQPVNEDLAKSFNLPSTRGALVGQIMPDTPAAKADIKEGDFITAIEGKEVADVEELRGLVAEYQPGKEIEVTLYRDGKEMKIKVKLEPQPADMTAVIGPEGAMPEPNSASSFGIQVSTMSAEMARQYGFTRPVKGALITEVVPGSNADEQGLRPGMVITSVNGKAVASAEEFAEAASAKEASDGIRVRATDRSGGSRYFFLKPEKPEAEKESKEEKP